MIRLLLKKQLAEIFRSYFYNPKKNEARSRGKTIGMFVFFVLVMVGLMGGMFGYLAWTLCKPLTAVGVEWLAFAIMGLLAVLFGAFGSVFNTFSGLYLGKDNDLLLSMPVPVRAILVARLLGVYLMGLMYSAAVCLPTLIVYWIIAGPTFANVAGGLWWCFLISMIVLILSCLLGWVVARISVKLKNRSIVTVLIALVGLGLYYFVYFKAQSLIRDLIANALVYGERIKGSARILYEFGRAGTGAWLPLGLMTVLVLAVFALVWYVLQRSFLKIATATAAVAKVRYREKAARQASADAALLRKELQRFVKSPNYMLNCGLGILLLPAMGIFLLIKGREFLPALQSALGTGGALALLAAMLFVLCSMNDMTAPSVSLEGRNLWQVQSLPVTPWQVLRAKLRMGLLLAGVPQILCGACVLSVLDADPVQKLLLAAFAGASVFLVALSGLALGVAMPNLTWTNETVPIKQSAPVFIVLFGGMGYGGLLAILYFVLKPDPTLYLGLAVLVTAALSAFLYFWLKTKGVAKFAAL